MIYVGSVYFDKKVLHDVMFSSVFSITSLANHEKGLDDVVHLVVAISLNFCIINGISQFFKCANE